MPTKFPNYFPSCHRFDPNINECLLTAAEEVRPYLLKGLPGFGIQPLEHFKIEEAVLEQSSQVLNFRADLEDISVSGLSTYKFTQFDFDVPNLQWFLKGSLGPLKFTGKYKIDGSVLVVPVKGYGDFTAIVESCDIDVYLKAKLTNINSLDYTEFTNNTIKIYPSGVVVDIKNLIDGDEQLSNYINKAINDNIEMVVEDIKPVLEKLAQELLYKGYFEPLFEKGIPFDNLYPPIP